MVMTNLTFAFAQQEASESVFGESNEESGAIEDASFEIVKERVNQLEKLERRYERVPPLPQPKTDSSNLDYNITEYNLSLPSYETRIRPKKINTKKKPRVKQNLLKLGFGNYITPYLEAYLVSQEKSNLDWGLHAKHLSSVRGSVDKKNSGYSNNELNASAKYTISDFLLKAGLNYQRKGVHYYGYDTGIDPVPSSSDIKQVYNQFNFDVGLKSLSKENFSWSTDLDFDYTKDKYESNESNFKISSAFDYQLSDGEWALGLDLDFNIGKYKNLNFDLNRSFFNLFPKVEYRPSDFSLTAGFKIQHQNDSTAVIGNTAIFPVVNLGYSPIEKLNLNVGLDGGMIQNTYSEFVNQNPFLDTNLDVQNTSENYKLYLDVAYSLTENLTLETGINIASFKNMPFYVNSASDSSHFMVIYDTDNTNKVNFFLNAGYAVTDQVDAGIGLDVYRYNTKELLEAWQLPTFGLKLFMNNKLSDKINISTVANLNSGMKARVETTTQGVFEAQNLKSIFDLDIKGDYKINDQFNAFLSLDNLLSQKQEYYYRYPSQGVLVLLGVGFSF